MVIQPSNTTEVSPLPRTKLKASSVDKSITIKVKSETLTPANNLEYTHDTRCRKKKSERRLIIEPPPLNLPSNSRALALLTPTVLSHINHYQQKNGKAESVL